MFRLAAVAEFHEHVDCDIIHPHCRCGAVIGNTDLGAGDACCLKRSQGSVDGLGLFESDHDIRSVCLALVPIVPRLVFPGQVVF